MSDCVSHCKLEPISLQYAMSSKVVLKVSEGGRNLPIRSVLQSAIATRCVHKSKKICSVTLLVFLRCDAGLSYTLHCILAHIMNITDLYRNSIAWNQERTLNLLHRCHEPMYSTRLSIYALHTYTSGCPVLLQCTKYKML